MMQLINNTVLHNIIIIIENHRSNLKKKKYSNLKDVIMCQQIAFVNEANMFVNQYCFCFYTSYIYNTCYMILVPRRQKGPVGLQKGPIVRCIALGLRRRVTHHSRVFLSPKASYPGMPSPHVVSCNISIILVELLKSLCND